MNKSELIDAMADDAGISKAAAKAAPSAGPASAAASGPEMDDHIDDPLRIFDQEAANS